MPRRTRQNRRDDDLYRHTPPEQAFDVFSRGRHGLAYDGIAERLDIRVGERHFHRFVARPATIINTCSAHQQEAGDDLIFDGPRQRIPHLRA